MLDKLINRARRSSTTGDPFVDARHQGERLGASQPCPPMPFAPPYAWSLEKLHGEIAPVRGIHALDVDRGNRPGVFRNRAFNHTTGSPR